MNHLATSISRLTSLQERVARQTNEPKTGMRMISGTSTRIILPARKSGQIDPQTAEDLQIQSAQAFLRLHSESLRQRSPRVSP